MYHNLNFLISNLIEKFIYTTIFIFIFDMFTIILSYITYIEHSNSTIICFILFLSCVLSLSKIFYLVCGLGFETVHVINFVTLMLWIISFTYFNLTGVYNKYMIIFAFVGLVQSAMTVAAFHYISTTFDIRFELIRKKYRTKINHVCSTEDCKNCPCSICLEANHKSFVLICNHVFHADCWYQYEYSSSKNRKNLKCPNCRTVLR